MAYASVISACILAMTAGTVSAAEQSETPAASEDWALHGQITNVTQRHPGFASSYQGANSLDAHGRTEETTDVTLYAGLRLSKNTELWINHEIDQGFGLSNTVGMAGFPSGEAYKIGKNIPYLRIPRAFLRQTWSLGQDQEQLAPALNQLGGVRSRDNLTVTVGKFSVTDIFDTNTYAHDPRIDFLNWSVIDSGAFDYAADAWGFTYGLAAELSHGDMSFRTGVFQLSPVPNGKITAVDFSQYMLVAEIEQRYHFGNRLGKFKLLTFANRGKMAGYMDAVSAAIAAGAVPDVATVRKVAWRSGIAVNLEQEVATGMGVFVRASANDGSKEAFEFTEINRSLAVGMALKGTRWSRPDDTIGIVGVANVLSADARSYFSHGGIGILIGDSGLSYGREQIIEAYYSARLGKRLTLSADMQHVTNPAYNRSRGPVQIYGLRLHAEL